MQYENPAEAETPVPDYLLKRFAEYAAAPEHFCLSFADIRFFRENKGALPETLRKGVINQAMKENCQHCLGALTWEAVR